MNEVMDDRDRLDAILEILGSISSLKGTHIVLVEGLKDISALQTVGVDADFFCVQSGGGPMKAAEFVWNKGMKAVIMTDWDRRGGNLAATLRENLSSLGVEYDDKLRSDLSFLCRPYCKDVESVDSVVGLLRRRVSDAKL